MFELGALLSPGDQFDTTVGGVTARCADGVHVTVPGGELVAQKLLPRLVALGRTHATLPSSQSRPTLPGGGPALVVLRRALCDVTPVRIDDRSVRSRRRREPHQGHGLVEADGRWPLHQRLGPVVGSACRVWTMPSHLTPKVW